MNTGAEVVPIAVALTYDGQGAPRVVAKGNGDVADRILATAREHGVPLQPDTELVRLLAQLELGDEIPRALYVAVAHVLAFAWAVTGKEPPARRRDAREHRSPLEGEIDQ
jgi:flagellar biosynthesis protein